MPSLSSFLADFERALAQGMQEGRKKTIDVALKKSSGLFSSSRLASMDYPYATRHGSPRLDPSTINVQTGAFRSAWKANPISVGADSLSFSIVNADPVADFLEDGTAKMFARPIREATEAEAEPLVVAAVERRLQRLLSQTYS